ncbi:DnaD domain protein [Candidatus Arthromitus sp. SFB-rat-Yit]|uniref:DnaD domain-containing protein n=1 Tax=Candidatus Arthromitus sp. SFB-rat-Yit TaxID=1041504 RepID=UPI000227A84C|nr:DnaD domain protein [Candidatus Arthromitus sp. SFB-rat-Yit]BAK81891.1 putative DNA replication protein DnaD [Candidatus Arthromitus sp. SFB-rat-Yit]
MSLYKLNSPFINYTLIDNNFIDNFLPNTRGEYVKIYILILKYASSGEMGFDTSFIAKTLNLLESDVKNALNYWDNLGLIKISTIDNKVSNIEFTQFSDLNNYPSSLNLINQITDNNLIDFFKEIESTIGRPLSQKEMETYINWTKNYNFSYELILYLISYCVNKNKKDFRYIEKVAITWSDLNINTLEQAMIYTEKREKQFYNIKKILTYMGLPDTEVSKSHEELFNKWLITYNMPLELIYKACDICCSKLSKNDLNYIDGILNNFKNSNVFSIEDFNKYESNKNLISKTSSNKSINKNSFSNFPQRSYDYDKLEKILTQNTYEENNTDD